MPGTPDKEENVREIASNNVAALSMHNFQGEDSPKLNMVTSIVELLDKKPLLVLRKFVDVVGGLVSGCVSACLSMFQIEPQVCATTERRWGHQRRSWADLGGILEFQKWIHSDEQKVCMCAYECARACVLDSV